MNAKTEIPEPGALDTVKLIVAAAILVAGIFGYYWYSELALPLRVLMVLVATGAGIGVGMTSTQGQALWRFIQGSRIEIRKVVWPTKQETTQTTIAVFVFTLILGLFFWGLDSILLLITRYLTGHAG
jgi:preprotein translocase subunit SecE